MSGYPYWRDEVEATVDRLVRESEAPVGVLWGLPDRRMPTTRAIVQAWASDLVLLNRFDSTFEVHQDGYACCWRCGMDYGRIERAHILARIEGGSDDARNFHMLCSSCHLATEQLSGRAYWSVFMRSIFDSDFYPAWLVERHTR